MNENAKLGNNPPTITFSHTNQENSYLFRRREANINKNYIPRAEFIIVYAFLKVIIKLRHSANY